MPLLLFIFGLFVPRILIVVLALFTDFLARAYDTILIPLIGFFILPTTTLMYAWAVNSRGGVEGPFWLLMMAVAVLFDIGSLGWETKRRAYA